MYRSAAIALKPAGRVIDQIDVALFDDHVAMRNALASALSRDPLFRIVGQGGSADEAVAVVEDVLPDVVVLDRNMPGSGIDAARRINRIAPACRIVIFTSEDEVRGMDAALSAGASATMIKGAPVSDLRDLLRQVAAGKSTITPSLAASLIGTRPASAPWRDELLPRSLDLLEREEQILLRLAQGLSSAEIGDGIGLSAATVEAFIRNIALKLHARRAGPAALG